MKYAAFILAVLHLIMPGLGRAAERILFVGNSITLHAPAPHIGWTGNWGMAATSSEKDYVHLVMADLERRAGRKLESKVVNLADFERAYETFDIEAKLRADVEFAADTVVVALGENVPALDNKEQEAKFKAGIVRLLKRLKGDGAKLYVRSCFWPDTAKDAAMRAACTEVGGVFVDIGSLSREEGNFARSERKIDHAGVAGHPGDKGMKAIAAAILGAMQSPAR